MASLTEAFPAPPANVLERSENPQAYDEPVAAVRHVKETRHILGLVGGKDVGRCAGSMADLESDLFGITRPNTWSTERKHLPPTSTKIERKNPKITLSVDATPVPLPESQMWAYPVVLGPQPVITEVCSRPEKY